MKLARQYFTESKPAQPQRTKFISRAESYHGTTLGALGVGGHLARRALFEPLLVQTAGRVSACNAYRGMRDGETVEGYVARLAQELDDEFQKLGPDTVCAFIAEPVVGAVSSTFRLIQRNAVADWTISGIGMCACCSRLFQSNEGCL